MTKISNDKNINNTSLFPILSNQLMSSLFHFLTKKKLRLPNLHRDN